MIVMALIGNCIHRVNVMKGSIYSRVYRNSQQAEIHYIIHTSVVQVRKLVWISGHAQKATK